MKKENDYYMRDAMRQYGGGFVMILGTLLEHADPINYEKLEKTFPEYFKDYREIGEKLKIQNEHGEKLLDLKSKDGNYKLGDLIYDKQGNFLMTAEEAEEELIAMQKNEERN